MTTNSVNPVNEEYYNRHSGIRDVLVHACMDELFISTADHFQSTIENQTNGRVRNIVSVVAYICELAKKDLALSLWKVLHDNNKKASTIPKLNNYLFKELKVPVKSETGIDGDSDKKNRPSINSIKKKTIPLNNARNWFIAHNQKDFDDLSIPVSDLVDALHDLIEVFNELTMAEIDVRVKPISDSDLFFMKVNERMGFDNMLVAALAACCNQKGVDKTNA